MTQTHNNTTTVKTANDNVLPVDAHMAMQQLIKISNDLMHIAETETQRLVQNDMVGFAMLQQEKEGLVNRYVKASSEFRTRLGEFQGIDQTLLARLDQAQKALGEKTQSNNIIVKRMNQKSEKKAVSSLLAAQEIAQNVCVKFPDADERDKMAH